MASTGKRFFRAVLLCASLLAAAASGTTAANAETLKLTLEEAIGLGLQNSTTLKAKAVSVHSGRASVKSAEASYYPSVSVSASYTHLFDQPSTSASSIDTPMGPMTIPATYVSASDPISLSVDLQQSVFTWGKIDNAVKLAKQGVELSQLDLEEEKRSLIIEIKKAFYGYILAEEVLAVQKETLAHKQEALDVTKKRFAAGLSPEYEVLSAESDVENFKPTVISAQNGLRFTLLAVMDLLGIEGDEGFDIELVGTLEPEHYEVRKAELIQKAMSNKYEIRQFERNVALQRIQQDITKAQNKPNVGAFVNYTLTSGFDSSTGENKYWGEDSWDGNLTLGILVTMPLSALFPWSRETAEIKKGELDIERMNLQLGSVKSGVRLNVENTVLKIEEEWAKIRSGEKGIELAEKLYDSALARYGNGLISSMELKDAQIGLNNAKLGYLQAVYNHKAALFELMNAVGVDDL
ncbi:MAG: TolC family protein [Spirochaetes bacterium]|nr:TolC family protein [Spirochaetota bacterium]